MNIHSDNEADRISQKAREIFDTAEDASHTEDSSEFAGPGFGGLEWQARMQDMAKRIGNTTMSDPEIETSIASTFADIEPQRYNQVMQSLQSGEEDNA